MGKIVNLKSRARINEEGAAWLSKLDRGLLHGEREALEEWLRSDSRHASAFIDLARVWDKLENLRSLSGLVELPPERNRRSALTLRRVSIAASFFILVSLVIIFNKDTLDSFRSETFASRLDRSSSEKLDNAVAWGERFETGAGERKTVSLPDGTSIELNTRSSLRVVFDSVTRRIELRSGEATFKVAHDSSRPFIVEAAGQAIRAVGTVFTIHARSQTDVTVLVSDGRVAISDLPPQANSYSKNERRAEIYTHFLEIGDLFERSGNDVQIEKLTPTALEDALSWQNGMIVFQGETLADALVEVARYSDVRFELTDKSLGDIRIAGVFQITDLNGFVDSLRVNFSIGARRSPGGTVSLFRVTEKTDTLSSL